MKNIIGLLFIIIICFLYIACIVAVINKNKDD